MSNLFNSRVQGKHSPMGFNQKISPGVVAFYNFLKLPWGSLGMGGGVITL